MKCQRFLAFPAPIDEFTRILSSIRKGVFLLKKGLIFVKKSHHRFYKVLNMPLFTCFLLEFPIGSLYFFRHGEVFLKVLN